MTALTLITVQATGRLHHSTGHYFGLRSAEVAALSLEDVNWREATVRICGKGDDHQLMPLPVEVGRALTDYLSDERRQSKPSRKVFLAVTPPYDPLGRNAKSQ